MTKPTMIILEITRDQVENKNFQSLEKLMKGLTLQGKQTFMSLSLSFGGYDADSRELYEIEEVREWGKEAVKRYPHIFLYLSNEVESFQILVMMIADELSTVKVGELRSPQERFEAGNTNPKLWPRNKVYISLQDETYEKIRKNLIKHAKDLKAPTKGKEAMALLDELVGRKDPESEEE